MPEVYLGADLRVMPNRPANSNHRGTNAQRTNDAIWNAFRREQERFGGDPSDFSSDLTQSGGVDDTPPEVRPVLQNTDRNQTRPGVIRTHDQGIMSGDEPEE